MKKNRFYARPILERATGRWIVDTNIDGLFVEGTTEKECREVIAEFALDLIRDNHGVIAASVSTERPRRASDQTWSSATPV